MIRTAFFNMLILMYLDERALAVMAVVNGFTAVVDSAIGGPGDATLLLGGVLFGQNDLRGQRKLLKTALLSSATLLFIITVCTCLFAEPLAKLFSENGESTFIAETARAIRLTSLCFVVDGLACVMKKYIQSVGRSKYTSITNVLCNVVYVGASAWLLVRFIGADGLYMSYTACYVLVLITHIIYALFISHSYGRSGFDILLFLPAGYEVSNEDQRVFTVDDIEGCVFASGRMADFCHEKGVDKRTTILLALFTEEITTNAVKHGFAVGEKNKIVVKALYHKDRIVLNFMDNCQLFDPWKYYDSLMDRHEEIGGIGIRLVAGLAKKVVYTNSFNLNNVMIEI